jgi:hypothetical protein
VHREAIVKHGLTPLHRRSFCEDPLEPEDLFAAAGSDPVVACEADA